MDIIFVFVLFFFMGSGIKFADESFDGKIFSKKISYFLLPLLIVSGLWLIFTNELYAAFLLAYLVAVLIGKKIDVLPFVVALLIFLAFFMVIALYFGAPSIAIIPLAVFFFSILIDELMNDAVEKKSSLFKFNFSKLFFYFFKYRMLTLLASIVLTYFGLIDNSFILLFLGWYLGYSFVEIVSSLTILSIHKKKA